MKTKLLKSLRKEAKKTTFMSYEEGFYLVHCDIRECPCTSKYYLFSDAFAKLTEFRRNFILRKIKKLRPVKKEVSQEFALLENIRVRKL